MNELILLEDLGMIYPTETSNKKRRYGLYKCVCGNEFNSQIQDVKSGKTKSCGCLKVTHGLKSHRLYSVWKAMISRCTNQANKGYKNYGGRGITVCDRWLDIQNFIEEDDEGNVEYKLKLVNPSDDRLDHLATQMKYRVMEGRG